MGLGPVAGCRIRLAPCSRLDGGSRLATYRVGAAIAGALPGSWADAVGRGAARLAAAASSSERLPGAAKLVRRRRLVERHLCRVCAPGLSDHALSRLAEESFVSYGRYWAETLRLAKVSPTEIRAGLRLEGLEHLDAALGSGSGAIAALPHLGAWEWGGAFLAYSGRPVSVVVERLSTPGLVEWFARLRRGLGMEVILTGPDAGKRCLGALADNRVLCLLADRRVDAGASVAVTFFGEVTQLPAGPATLALRSGAPLLPSAVYFAPACGLWGRPDHIGHIGAPLVGSRRGSFRQDVRQLTQELAGHLELLIRQAPTQWHLMQPNWPSDPGYPCL